MKFRKTGGPYVLALSRGERIVETLAGFCGKETIRAGYFSGLGSCRGAELGFFDWNTKKYRFKKFSGDFEIAALQGNISLLNGRPFVHAHVVLGDKNFRCAAGHLKEAEVLAACEIVLVPLRTKLLRKLDTSSDIYPLSF
jgi:predicted DNA-binding protein with PD1-like motif